MATGKIGQDRDWSDNNGDVKGGKDADDYRKNGNS